MANNNRPFDQATVGFGERPVSLDINRALSLQNHALRDALMHLLAPRASASASSRSPVSAFVADGFRVGPSAVPGMTVVVTSGLGFLYDLTDLPDAIGAPDIEGLSDLSPFKPVVLNDPITFAVPAAPVSPNSRVDIIEIRTDRLLGESDARQQINPATRTFLPKNYYKTLSFSVDDDTGTVTDPVLSTAGLSYRVGQVGNPGAAPSTTPGYTKIAEINVVNGTTSITGMECVDRRKLHAPGGVVKCGAAIHVLYNGGGGAQTATIVAAAIPPGIDIGVTPIGSGRANFRMFLLGGEMSGVVENVNVGRATVTSNTSITVQPFRAISGVPLPLTTVTNSGFQTNLAAAGLAAGIGQTVIEFDMSGGAIVHRDATGAGDGTDTSLEDVIFDVSFLITYY